MPFYASCSKPVPWESEIVCIQSSFELDMANGLIDVLISRTCELAGREARDEKKGKTPTPKVVDCFVSVPPTVTCL